MYSIEKVKKANESYEEERKKLNKLDESVRKINDNLDLEEVKNTLTHAEAKELYKLILSRNSDIERCNLLKSIVEDKKAQEYPQINDVHYYPEITSIEFLSKEERIALDKTMKEAYRSSRASREISKMDSKIIKFLMENSIVEKLYIFRCNCGSDECFDKEISQEYFDKLKEYWEKEMGEGTTHEEDREMNYGCFSTVCWNDGDVEVCSLDDFNEKLRFIKYKVVKEPDMTLDRI